MSGPFKIQGPALISFSGGRTSGYMLWRILQAHGGTLPEDVRVTFANTGKEMPQTLDFVRDCGERWGVEIVWLEYRAADDPQQRWERVTYETASREGQPFKALIEMKPMLPTPGMRYCTIEMKARCPKLFAQQELGWDHWDNCLGLRYDEPRRVAKARNNSDVFENRMPLFTAKITKADVGAFWQRQNFDLRLPNINNKTPHGNCDLCFLKSVATKQAIMRDMPSLAGWWLLAEADAAKKVAKHAESKPSAALFRLDHPSYRQMWQTVQSQAVFDYPEADDSLSDCFCGDGT